MKRLLQDLTLEKLYTKGCKKSAAQKSGGNKLLLELSLLEFVQIGRGGNALDPVIRDCDVGFLA